jgi:hypothetical protein
MDKRYMDYGIVDRDMNVTEIGNTYGCRLIETIKNAREFDRLEKLTKYGITFSALPQKPYIRDNRLTRDNKLSKEGLRWLIWYAKQFEFSQTLYVDFCGFKTPIPA